MGNNGKFINSQTYCIRRTSIVNMHIYSISRLHSFQFHFQPHWQVQLLPPSIPFPHFPHTHICWIDNNKIILNFSAHLLTIHIFTFPIYDLFIVRIQTRMFFISPFSNETKEIFFILSVSISLCLCLHFLFSFLLCSRKAHCTHKHIT